MVVVVGGGGGVWWWWWTVVVVVVYLDGRRYDFENTVSVWVVSVSHHVALEFGAVSIGEALGRRRQTPNLLLAFRARQNFA